MLSEIIIEMNRIMPRSTRRVEALPLTLICQVCEVARMVELMKGQSLSQSLANEITQFEELARKSCEPNPPRELGQPPACLMCGRQSADSISRDIWIAFQYTSSIVCPTAISGGLEVTTYDNMKKLFITLCRSCISQRRIGTFGLCFGVSLALAILALFVGSKMLTAVGGNLIALALLILGTIIGAALVFDVEQAFIGAYGSLGEPGSGAIALSDNEVKKLQSKPKPG